MLFAGARLEIGVDRRTPSWQIKSAHWFKRERKETGNAKHK